MKEVNLYFGITGIILVIFAGILRVSNPTVIDVLFGIFILLVIVFAYAMAATTIFYQRLKTKEDRYENSK